MIRRKYFIKIFILVNFFIVFFISCKKNNSENISVIDDISLAQVLVKSKIVVGVDTSHPPLCFTDKKGNIVGFDVDVLSAVADTMDIDIEFVSIMWSEKIELLKNHKIDCVASGFSKTPEREKKYEMTKPYFRNAQIILVLKQSGFTSIKNLKEKSIAGQKNTVGLDIIKNDEKYKNYFKDIREYDNTMQGISDVKNRGIDAAIADISIITDILKKNSNIFTVLKEPLALDFYVYAFRKGDVSLKNEVDKILIELESLGILEKISRKWFDADILMIGK